MKKLTPKVLAFTALAALSLSTAHSISISPIIDTPTNAPALDNISNTFSHGVLVVPGGGPENEQAWSQVITNQEDWKTLFGTHLAVMTFAVGHAPVLPVIDFEKYQIVSGGFGAKPSSGYSLVVNTVSETDTNIVFDMFEISPGEECINMPVISYPSATIFIKKTDKPFQFNVRKVTESCLLR
ncbi:MAG: protease complex subunit PrcB family protein [Methylococcales bacterium]|nr:protease complex subunit PrcB family protein [Methylococcales bacterium]